MERLPTAALLLLNKLKLCIPCTLAAMNKKLEFIEAFSLCSFFSCFLATGSGCPPGHLAPAIRVGWLKYE